MTKEKRVSIKESVVVMDSRFYLSEDLLEASASLLFLEILPGGMIK